jgi:hypothetical protein
MASMTEITCACGCGRKKMVRTADVARGWGKYYSKSCKARHQTRMTGRGRPKVVASREDNWISIYEEAEMDAGWAYLQECGDKE